MSPPDMPTKTPKPRSTETSQRQNGQLQTPQRPGDQREDWQQQDIPRRVIRRAGSYLLTKQQIRCMEQLPEGHKLVSTRSGAPIVRRPDGRLLRVQPNGRFATTISVERVQSYLRLNESMG